MSEEHSSKETAKAHAAFVEYCALGPGRSLAKLAGEMRQSDVKATSRLRTLQEWSALYNWQERVKQYDTERAEERRIARERAREEAEDRQAREAQEEQAAARKLLLRRAEEDEIGTFAAVQWLKNSRDDERKALGMDETVKTKVELTGKDGGPVDILTKWNGGSKVAEDKADAES